MGRDLLSDKESLMDGYAPHGRRPHPLDVLMLVASLTIVAWALIPR
jgi:hypothetical protein